MAGNARDEVLSRIRAGLARPFRPNGASWEDIPRDYQCLSTATQSELIDRLTHRLQDYGAQVISCGRAGLVEAVRAMLAARGVQKLLVPEGFTAAMLPEGFSCVVDRSLTLIEMDACDGVMTEATLAIAETGSIVLQNTAGQGRRAASLVPDYHLCLVDVARIKATVPEAISALAATSSLPTTFISGPSATADIEMTRIKGVHGPRSLDIILILDETEQTQRNPD